MFKVTTTLRFTSEEFRIIQEVLARLDPFLYGDEFHINKLGNLVQVISRKEHRCWHFNSKEYLLGHFNALYSFTSNRLYNLK
ncbi:hypothetical protein VCSRO91_3587 [Vibrio cholerae]|nr:hypothetical protein VCSRO91_3587 [Vibrio cholerae]